MAASLNKVTIIGNVGRDPEVRTTPDGSKVVTISVATSDEWRDRETEEKKERVEWHRVVVFNPRLAQIAERFLKKGQKVYIEGQIQSRKWVDTQNQEHRTQEIIIRFKGEIIILDGRESSSEYKQGTSSSAMNSSMKMDSSMQIDDEVPY